MITLKIGNRTHAVDASGDLPLLWILRAILGLIDIKFGGGSRSATCAQRASTAPP